MSRRRVSWRWPGRQGGGLPAVLGALALVLAAGLALWATPRWRQERELAEQTLQRRLAQARAARAPAAPPADPVRALQTALPEAGRSAQRLADLLALAQRHGLAIASVQQAAPLAGEGVDSQAIRWHGNGPYAAWRSFVAEALQRDAALVLEQLRLSRSGAQSERLEADLQWQLLQRGERLAAPVAGRPAPGRGGS